MREPSRIPALVLVEWVDSARPEPAWRHLDDAPSLEVICCQSVGWLIDESAEVMMLAPNLGDIKSEQNMQASGFMRIPRSAIKRQACLQEKT